MHSIEITFKNVGALLKSLMLGSCDNFTDSYLAVVKFTADYHDDITINTILSDDNLIRARDSDA